MELNKFYRKLSAQIILLLIQFLLGMFIVLFINVPQSLTATFWQSSGALVVELHMLVALAILIMSILLYIESRNLRDKSVRRMVSIGGVFVWLAALSGIVFLFFGASNIFSYIMAISFVIAFGSYVFLAGRLAKWYES